MNQHLRAFLIVSGIAVLVGVVSWAVIRDRQERADVADSKAPAVQLNVPLADFTAPDLAGRSVQLSSFKGKVVIVNFWASWCTPCVEEMPSLIKLVQAFPKDVELLAISGDSSRADIDAFLKSFPELKTLPNVHIVFDENKALAQKYQIYRLPESVVLNSELAVVKKISGIINWASPDAFEYMKALIGKDKTATGSDAKPAS